MCSSDLQVFQMLDYSKIFQINSGLAVLSGILDPVNYKNYNLWECKSCFEFGKVEFNG